MKNFTKYLTIMLLGVFLVQACGPSEQDIQEREQARLDSLERVRVMQQERATADSLARVQRQMEEERRLEEERRTVNFTDDGQFSVQVGAWRARDTAERQISVWKDRGYEKSFVVQYGEESTGDIWYRVRLGRVADRNEAEKLQDILKEDYEAPSWISRLY